MPPKFSHSKEHFDELKSEVQRLTQIIAKMSEEEEEVVPDPSETNQPPVRRATTTNLDIGMAKWLLDERDNRQSAFSSFKLDDTPWNILLDLYVAGRNHRLVSITSACIAARSPPTTALRSINALEEAGFVKRSSDQHDGRRVHLRLSAYAEVHIAEYLEKLADSLKMLIAKQPYEMPVQPIFR